MIQQSERKTRTIRADLLELVFRSRNRQYGAYPLRKAMPRRLLASFLITITLLVLGVEMPRIVARLGLTTVVIEEVETPNLKDKTTIIRTLELPPPPKAPIMPAPPTPETPEPPQAGPQLKTEVYVPPVVKPDVAAPNTPPVGLDVPTDNSVAVGSTNAPGEAGGIAGGTPGGTGTNLGDDPNGTSGGTIGGDGVDWTAVDQKIAPVNMAEFVRSVRYPTAAREAGVKGSVTLRLLVDEHGDIREHQILQSSHPLLGTAVTDKLPLLKFTKATQNGQPVRYWVVLPVKFHLR